MMENCSLNFEAFYLCGRMADEEINLARVYSLSDALDLFCNYPEYVVFSLYGKLSNGSKVFIGSLHV